MPQRSRPLNRFAVALALIGVLAGVRASVQMFAAPPSTFSTLPNLNFNQGQSVTVAFAAQGFPSGITYTAEGLPAGLTFAMGVDTLGHDVGIMSGTLAADTPTTAGSEGVYNVRILASDNAVSNFFAIDVSFWSQGDVFVGAGEWNYQVYREDGTFKADWTVPDDTGLTYGATTGCAVNWRTGEVWATNFDEILPAVNVITRHAGSNPLPFTDPSRRLSTERYGSGNGLTPVVGNLNPFDTNPESVAFDNNGNMFVGHSFGYWNDDFDVADANGTPIILHNPSGEGWVYVDALGQPILDGTGNMLFDTNPISPAGFFEKWMANAFPVNILDANAQPIPVPQQGGMDVHKYTPDVNGNYNQATRQFFDFHYGNTGIDTLDLLSDQKTMTYSSEDWYMYRYDVAADAQMPVVGSSVLGESRPIGHLPMYGLRVLPPGDGTGGYLVVDQYEIHRLDENGRKVQKYDVNGDADYLGDPDAGWLAGDVNGWFAIAIAPDGRTFWAATRQDVFRFDVASGAQIGTKIHATVGTLHTNQELAGLCVMDEYRAAQEVCGANGLGNGVDDDNDGTIDEGCFRVEICSVSNPGDDDGDGLVDYNDPDCGAQPAQQCVTNGPTDNSVAGFCDRADYEGDDVVVPGIPLPCGDCSDWNFSYNATGLPDGLTMNPNTGEVTGMPLFSIVNPNSELSPPVVYAVTVNSTWQRAGQAATSFTNTFNWTIYNRNRVPEATDDGPQALMAGASFAFDVRANGDGDIDGDTITIDSFTQPLIGQGSVVQDGQNLVYTAPLTGFGGTTTFTYKVKDTYNPAGVSNDATVTVIVNGPPVARDDFYDGLWNTPLNVSVAQGIVNKQPGSDFDPDGSAVTVVLSSVTSPSNGTVAVNADGSFTYTPNTGFSGTDTYQYRVTDGTLESNLATVTIVIRQPPVAVDDFYTTPMNTPLVLTVPGIMVNDSDPNGLPILVNMASVGNAIHGTKALLPDGSMVYTPNPGFFGVETFQYRVKNGFYESNTAFVTIKINAPPVANPNTYTTPEDTTLVIGPNGILGNDTDPNNDPLQVVVGTATATSHGTVTLNPNGDGGFVYEPNANFHGTDTFTYQVNDGTANSNFTTVTIIIEDVDDLPVANDDGFTTAEEVPVSGTLVTNDALSGDGGNVWSKTGDPSNGTATVNANGTFSYTPNANFFGTDTFTYQICDLDGDCDPATVTITVTPVDDAPVAVNDAFTTAEDTPVSGSLTGNDTPSGDGGNIWSKVTDPSNGTATVNADGTFTYTPNDNFFGTDSFTYNVCDTDGDCSTATVTITITSVDDAPVAVNDSFTTAEDTPLNGTLTGNDTPSGDGGNVWSKTSNPSNGSATVNANGTFTYTPNANFSGTDSFTYQVCDGDGDCSTATVTITIDAVDDAPVAVNDSFTTAEDTPVSGTLTGNDTPSGDGGNVWSKTSDPTNGTATVNADGTFTYTPNANFSGTDTFTYQVCDADGDCSTATVTITINSVDDAPVAVNDAFTTAEETPISGTLTGNDTPSGDGGNVWSKVSNPANGTATVNADGTFTYTPNANFFGTDSFTYKVCDADNDCSTATVTITITSVDDAPVAVDDAFTTAEDTPVNGTLTGNDTPSGDGGNVWSKTSNPSNGTATVNANGTFTYTPNANFFGTDTFTYQVCDVDGDCSTATVTIEIASVNDVPVAVNDTYTIPGNTVLNGTAQSNDMLSGDGGNVWTQLTSPASGTLVFSGTGAFTYTPVSGFAGTVTFNYLLCDVNNDCSAATVTIVVTPVSTGGVGTGDTATIGYWQNNNGQALIKKMNGSASATNLGNWLASSYPYLFGANAGTANNMTGKTNTQVAAYYIKVFKADKWMAQVLAGAIASYVTNSTLAGGNYSVPYGFNLSSTGTGAKTWNVGSNGTAIGLTNNTSYTVSALLQQANLRKQQGTYNANAFNRIFSGINEAGDIR